MELIAICHGRAEQSRAAQSKAGWFDKWKEKVGLI